MRLEGAIILLFRLTEEDLAAAIVIGKFPVAITLIRLWKLAIKCGQGIRAGKPSSASHIKCYTFHTGNNDDKQDESQCQKNDKIPRSEVFSHGGR